MTINQPEIEAIQRGWESLERREMMPLRVYRPMEQQEPFHRSGAKECIVRGGKRSGKTLCVAMEFASRVLGMPVYGKNSQMIPLRYDACTKDDPKLYWVIGLDVKHIGQTLYHRLFSPGLGCKFKIIQAPFNGIMRWVAYNQNNPWHKANAKKAKLSPPLFPQSMIEPGSWHMDSAAGNIFHSVRLINGATICAYASTGDYAKQGDAVDGIWIDEDIASAGFLKEWQDRLISVNGWLLWSAWPKAENLALIQTLERAKKEADELLPGDEPKIEVFNLVGSENKYSSKEGIELGLARMDDDDDVAHRDRGDIEGMMSEIRMYDFSPAMHLVKAKINDQPDNPHALIESLLQRYSKLPAEWTRYLAIDPSHTRTACLFGVVPPPEWEGITMGNRLIVERELVLKKHTPQMFAEALAKLVGGMHFEAFIMDQQIGRATTVGADVNVFDAYGREFAKRGILSRSTKSGFAKGCNDKRKRRNAVRSLLEPTVDDGWPSLFFDHRMTYFTQKELYSYKKKKTEDKDGEPVITDDAVNERRMDCMAGLEYLAEYVTERFHSDTAYVPPEAGISKGSVAYQMAQALLQKRNEATGNYVHLGPGAAA